MTTGAQPGRRPRGARQRRAKAPTPFPKQQMLVLALCRICEPIAFMSIFPYIYYMIEDFKITTDTTKISFYAGMVTSAFTFAEFSTGMLWGRLSDKIGRKPVLLAGLSGTAISVLVFGFAPNLPVALLARALGGLLNGNIGVLQTTVAELVTVKEHQPRAYTIMPLVWCLGSIVGPMIGGALARPCVNYPTIFAGGTIWEKFPYLLPNLFSAGAVFCGVVVGILFLEETHAEKRKKHDPGLALGRKLVESFEAWKAFLASIWRRDDKFESLDVLEGQSLLDSDSDNLPGYLTNGRSRSPKNARPAHPTRDEEQEEEDELEEQNRADEETGLVDPEEKKDEKKQVIFTKTVILNIVSYGIMAFHTMTFDALFPVFLSTDKNTDHSHFSLPFKFVDGFGMETKQIGIILSVQGFYSLLSNTFLFPPICKRLGALNLFRLITMSYFLLYIVTPYIVLLPEDIRWIGIYVIVIWKCTFSTLAYPSNAILLTNSAPSSKILGTINGVAASTASLCRALGPTVSGALYAMGIQTGYSGLAWWCSGLVTIVGAFISTQLTEPRGRMDTEEGDKDDEEEDLRSALIPEGERPNDNSESRSDQSS